MKNKFLLTALAVPMLFAACSDDEFVTVKENGQTQVIGDKIYLGNDFVLGAERTAGEGVETRLAWESKGGKTALYFIPKKITDNSDLLNFSSVTWSNYEKDALGMCYVNGNEILTNYKFEHDGWVEWDQDFANIPFQCVDGKRGYERTYLRFGQLETASSVITVGDINDYYSVKGTLGAAVDSKVEIEDKTRYITDLNLSKGIFKTDEKTIFAGDYVAYMPWSDGMLQAGKLTATSKVKMEYQGGIYDNRIADLNKYTFACGYVADVDGGTEAEGMRLTTLTKLLSLKLSKGDPNATKKLVLLDPQGSFINTMELDPQDIKNGNFVGSNEKKSQSIQIDFANELVYTSGVNSWATVYVPTFPTTIPAGVYIIAVDPTSGASIAYQTTKAMDMSKVNLAFNVTNNESDAYTSLELAEFGYDVVTNETELMAAASSSSIKPILLVGNIEVTSNIILKAGKKLVGFIDDKEVGSLTLAPSNTYYEFKTLNNTTFDCNVRVMAPGCCHTKGGVLFMKGTTLAKDRTILNENKVIFDEATTNVIRGTLNNQPFVEPDEEGLTYTAIEPLVTLRKKSVVYVYGQVNNKVDKYNGSRLEGQIVLDSDDVTGAARKDAELSITKDGEQSGKLDNNGKITNYGTISNQTGVTANITSNDGSTYLQKIGGQLTGALLKKTSDRMDYICEVDNATDSRWETAWKQGLANIIWIVATQNTAFNNALGKTYPFEINGKVYGSKKVQVVVENPDIYFVGKKVGNVSAGYELTPVQATIGRLKVLGAALRINTVTQKVNDATYKTIHPLELTVDNSEWSGIEAPAGGAEDAVYVATATTLTHNKYAIDDLSQTKLNVVGVVKVAGTYVESGQLAQTGNLNVLTNGRVDMNEDAKFSTTNINIEDGANSENKGVKIAERVNGEVSQGITIAANSYLEMNGDAVVEVAGVVDNNGKAKWISRTGTRSPGIIWCEDFTASNPANWVNGTPILNSTRN